MFSKKTVTFNLEEAFNQILNQDTYLNKRINSFYLNYLPWFYEQISDNKEEVEIYEQITENHINQAKKEITDQHMRIILDYFYAQDKLEAMKAIGEEQ